MKVAMVAPMARASAIADVMSQAVPELSSSWDLDIWCPDAGDLRTFPPDLHVFATPDESVIAAITSYDLVIYVLGDSAFHVAMLPIMRAHPGLVVLHDAVSADLLLMRAIRDRRVDDLARYVESAYGQMHAEVLARHSEFGGKAEWFELLCEAPMAELLTYNALGVVVHSRWHAEQVDGLSLGEVTVAPLPVPSAAMGMGQERTPKADQLLAELPDDAILLVTVGMVNLNRRVDDLLEALADAPDLERVHFWAVGQAGPRDDTTALAQSLGLGDRFAITGRVSDQSLTDILERADLAAALRKPVLEGASASVLTQMLAGKPVLVYDHGHYRDLPDDAVVKVAPHDGAAGLRAALRRALEDPHGRRAIGERGRAYVETTRTGDAYGRALREAGEAALARRPFVNLAHDVGRQLERLDLHHVAAVRRRVAELSFELFELS